ncbi:MAG: hypothetical protein IJ489_07265 [Clostridia bacterium]|nr:hypothetical protein [Clostridia bacterium]
MGHILKIFSKFKDFSLKVVENSVDNVEKNVFSFPQNDVENLKCHRISSFGNEWKRKSCRFSQNKGREHIGVQALPAVSFCPAFSFRKEKAGKELNQSVKTNQF